MEPRLYFSVRQTTTLRSANIALSILQSWYK